jgi:hypothetical protein
MSKSGYVYILSNPSMPDIVKIGMSSRGGEKRAVELHNTGTPTPFKLEFEIYVDDCRELEGLIHERFQDNRVSNGREFFRVDVSAAIEAIIERYVGDNLNMSLMDDASNEGVCNLAQLAYKINAHPFEMMCASRFLSLNAVTDAYNSYRIWLKNKDRIDKDDERDFFGDKA